MTIESMEVHFQFQFPRHSSCLTNHSWRPSSDPCMSAPLFHAMVRVSRSTGLKSPKDNKNKKMIDVQVKLIAMSL